MNAHADRGLRPLANDHSAPTMRLCNPAGGLEYRPHASTPRRVLASRAEYRPLSSHTLRVLNSLRSCLSGAAPPGGSRLRRAVRLRDASGCYASVHAAFGRGAGLPPPPIFEIQKQGEGAVARKCPPTPRGNFTQMHMRLSPQNARLPPVHTRPPPHEPRSPRRDGRPPPGPLERCCTEPRFSPRPQNASPLFLIANCK